VPSSTSSSSRRLPPARWGIVLGGAIAVWALFVGLMELELAHRGVQPTMPDSERLWIRQRALASRLGERAVVLVGASKILLDTDLGLLRERSGLEPVQLAVDGGSFAPVLRGLAADPSFRGAVVIDYVDDDLARPGGAGDQRAQHFEDAYAAAAKDSLPGFSAVEAWLTDQWRRRLRSYADGAKPVTALGRRVLERQAPQYLVMLDDRSHLADYSRIDTSLATLNILRRHGLRVPGSARLPDDEARIRGMIGRVGPRLAALPTFERETQALAAEVAALRARGARVYFLLLPRSGLVRDIEERLYPRRQFWDRFASRIGAPAVHFEDVPGMRELACPDGIHLDYRQRDRFTAALVGALGLERR